MRTRNLSKTTAALAIVAALSLSACGGSDDAAESGSASGSADAAGSTIELSGIDNEFEPTELEVVAGEEITVNFTNDGETVHTFTSDELGFDTGNVEGGDSKTVTFTAPEEEVEFVCTIHADSDDMVGTIVPQ